MALTQGQFAFQHAQQVRAIEQTGEMIFANLLLQNAIFPSQGGQAQQQRIAQRGSNSRGINKARQIADSQSRSPVSKTPMLVIREDSSKPQKVIRAVMRKA